MEDLSLFMMTLHISRIQNGNYAGCMHACRGLFLNQHQYQELGIFTTKFCVHVQRELYNYGTFYAWGFAHADDTKSYRITM